MKKILYCLLLVSSVSFAKGGFNGNEQDMSGIVTPDISVAFSVHSRYTHNIDGSGMSVCRTEDWEQSIGSGKCKKWTPVEQTIPPGRQFVGFRVVSGANGHRLLEIYWK